MRSRRPRGGTALVTAVVTVALSVALSVAGCGGSGSGAAGAAPPSAAEFLTRAKTTLDGASSVHFTLTSADVPAGANVLLGGEGDAVRPDRFSGTLDVRVAGAQASVAVVALGGTVYAKLPFTSKYAVTDPKTFNIPDPGTFMSTETGLTQLLAQASGPQLAGTSRVGDTVVQQVTAQLPGAVVDRVLRTADPATAVRATFGIDPETGRLRVATLVGPFFTAGVDSTYTLNLSRYGEPVDIRAPAG